MKRGVDLTEGSIGAHILRMTPPMAGAFLAMMVFNLADTWFVSRLGTVPLAAMGFTFPVMMVLHSLAMGIGLGTSAGVSAAIGRGDHDQVRHLATYSLVLGLLCFVVLAVVGWVLTPRMLGLLGAEDEAARLAAEYLRVLLLFVPIGVLPMIGNNAIRATGDTLRPSLIMAGAAILNCILDPIMIFGWGVFPALGIKGAALATGISRIVTWGGAMWLLHYRCHLLTRDWTGWSGLFAAWRRILNVAIPASATNLLMPFTAAVITRMIAGHGHEAVAATAAGQRIEHFAAIVPIAMGTVLVPLIGQNWGARKYERVREAWVKTCRYGIVYAASMLALSSVVARPIAALFSDDTTVRVLITHYLWIMLTGGILMHVGVHTTFAFNAVDKPLKASALTAMRAILFVIPLAWLGARIFGLHGIYLGMASGHLLSGIIAIIWFLHFLRHSGQDSGIRGLGD